MAATLFKLVITADTTTTVSTKPDVQRLFYNVNPTHIDQGVLTIPANAFVDDEGAPVTTIPTAATDNGYYLLFINGVLQQEDLYTVSDTEVVIQDATSIQLGSPITLIVTNFAPEADSTTTVTT